MKVWSLSSTNTPSGEEGEKRKEVRVSQWLLKYIIHVIFTAKNAKGAKLRQLRLCELCGLCGELFIKPEQHLF